MNPLLFTDPSFLFLFAPVVLTLYWIVPARARNLVLLAASLLLYWWGESRYGAVLVASIVINWGAGEAIARSRERWARKLAMRAGVALNLLLLAVFKYSTFIVMNLDVPLERLGFRHIDPPDLHLPIGLSFYTFMGISYLVDLYRGDLAAAPGLTRVALYLSMFPHLIAGPIVRMTEIAPQFGLRLANADRMASGVRRFVIGFGKKMLIANTVAIASDGIFALPAQQIPASLAWFALVCYTLQIYYDFSGYSDMAIGLARILGFEFPENFNYPYVSQSIGEFWRRWHITLSAWLRDYLFFPLGGIRSGRLRVAVNQLIVFLLCGLWHGASYTFIAWGLWHGLLLGIEQLGFEQVLRKLPAPVRAAYTLLAVSLGWVLFRSATLHAAASFFRALIGFGPAAPPDRWIPVEFIGHVTYIAIAAGILGAVPLAPVLTRLANRYRPGFRPGGLLGFAEFAALSCVLITALAAAASGTFHPFIYFRF